MPSAKTLTVRYYSVMPILKKVKQPISTLRPATLNFHLVAVHTLRVKLLRQLINWPIMVWLLVGLCECVCSKALKLDHGEIIGPSHSDGHYRSTTCIVSFLLVFRPSAGELTKRAALWTVLVCVNYIWMCVCVCSQSLVCLLGVCFVCEHAHAQGPSYSMWRSGWGWGGGCACM